MSITHLPTDDPTLVNRYLDDQLTDAEREAFEARMVEDPTVLRELEATARLKLGMEKLRRQGKLENIIPVRRASASWPMGMAAALAVLMIGIGVWRVSTNQSIVMAASPAGLRGDATSLQVMGPFPVYRKRSSDAHDGDVLIPVERQVLEVKLLAPFTPEESTPLRVSIVKVSEGPRVESEIELDHPVPDADGFITIFMDSAQVSPGIYELKISGTGSSSEPEILRVRFVAQE